MRIPTREIEIVVPKIAHGGHRGPFPLSERDFSFSLLFFGLHFFFSFPKKRAFLFRERRHKSTHTDYTLSLSFTRTQTDITNRHQSCGELSFSSLVFARSVRAFDFGARERAPVTVFGQQQKSRSFRISHADFPERALTLCISLLSLNNSEIVHIQAGQCGNQIGAKFWEVRGLYRPHRRPRFLFLFLDFFFSLSVLPGQLCLFPCSFDGTSFARALTPRLFSPIPGYLR